MSTALSISDVGLRLIKAYEGFRPVDVELVSGQRVAGYGHRVMGGRSLHLTEKKAEDLLKRDLAPFEAMINDHIFAPLTQSQFDALCSLAYNIGPKKFLESDVVRAINNGRILDAANGFDVWRMGRINGESYVVDALVRRRTAEKVLFLRPVLASAKAPRVDLAAIADSDMLGATTAAAAPILEDSGLVASVNYPAQAETSAPKADIQEVSDQEAPEAGLQQKPKIERRKNTQPVSDRPTPMRRRDDRPGGVLTLSEVFEDEQGQPDPIVQEIGDFMSDLKTSVAPDDEFDDTPSKASLSKSAADAAPLELDDIVEYDDAVLPAELIDENVKADNILELNNVITDEEDIDPTDYIVAGPVKTARANDVDDDILELSGADEAPSPIASAAAEVSGRLDALMADEPPQSAEKPKNVLPFRASKTPDKKPIIAGKNSPLYASLIEPREAIDTAEETDVQAPSQEVDSGAQQDSAARYLKKSASVRKEKPKKTALSFMVIAGMTMLGASVGAILSGWDQRYGAGGEFLSTTGALLGLMITLGSIYYILKKSSNK